MNALLDKMENIEVKSLEQATLVVGVISMATDNSDEITDESQVSKHCSFCFDIMPLHQTPS